MHYTRIAHEKGPGYEASLHADNCYRVVDWTVIPATSLPTPLLTTSQTPTSQVTASDSGEWKFNIFFVLTLL